MVISHNLTNNLGAFAIGTIRCQPHISHTHKDSAVDRLQTVAHIGQGPPDDDTHRVIDIRPPHLVFDIDWNEIYIRWRWWRGWCDFVCHKIWSLDVEVLHFE